MQRRTWLLGSLGGLGVLGAAMLGAWWPWKQGQAAVNAKNWQGVLTPQQYHILFEEGTEPSGSSPLNQEKRLGTYVCAACFLPLFKSEYKYESGTGWPSFFDAIPEALGTHVDKRWGMVRTEYHCVHCGGHHGHVFEDGPAPTGLRYCNNGLALQFVVQGEPLPSLRNV
jgi:peptide-methionine (R)-S-oxide reductase